MNRDRLLGTLQFVDLVAVGVGAAVLVLCVVGYGNWLSAAFAIAAMALGGAGIVLVELARYAR